MPALDPDVAALRSAVRRALRPHAPHPYAPGARDTDTAAVALVACSGGTDSLALAASVAFVAPRMGLRAGLVTVDHGLQPGSAQRASLVADWATGSGFDPVLVRDVRIDGRPGGPEAAAREARYEALIETARSVGAAAVLLGHTRDDQAETVLLALVRGAGARGLAGMAASRRSGGVVLLRPLLSLRRAQTAAACVALGLVPWHDPHNADPAFTRTRARRLLAQLVGELGPGVVANLARTAELAADDTEAIDGFAQVALLDALVSDGGLQVPALRRQPTAIRRAVLRAWLRQLGVPGAALAHNHLVAVDALIVAWRGQRGVSLPGGQLATRHDNTLRLTQRTSSHGSAGHEAGLGHG